MPIVQSAKWMLFYVVLATLLSIIAYILIFGVENLFVPAIDINIYDTYVVVQPIVVIAYLIPVVAVLLFGISWLVLKQRQLAIGFFCSLIIWLIGSIYILSWRI
ncbi:hypothetical protein SAMN05421740_110157 [Parapedobacter koreensis]|uniref:Uncharacterized protein n=1 Tax=Parapedobacter koreensis TaxID=332977 RepID=A0A1H7T9P5_9SPHI|nr:hypothetical protein SAMN05421740_110157 [Parapedobacter koreensis]